MKGLAKVSQLRTPTQIPQGPRLFRQKPQHVGGPGLPPPGFVVGQTSASEWNLYWAFAKIFDNPKDPRQQPFYGGAPDWSYQVPFLGAYTRAPGSAVVDYVIYKGREVLGVRLQTIRFHYVTTASKQAYDALQQFQLERYIRVVDINEEDVIGDESGEKYVVTAKRAIGLISGIDPIVAGIDPRRRFV